METTFYQQKIAILSTSKVLKYEETSFIEKRNKITNSKAMYGIYIHETLKIKVIQ